MALKCKYIGSKSENAVDLNLHSWNSMIIKFSTYFKAPAFILDLMTLSGNLASRRQENIFAVFAYRICLKLEAFFLSLK